MSSIIIYTDGGARNNPGPAGAGVIIIDGKKKIELKKFLGSQTNNWAEYEAVVLALTEARKQGFEKRDIEVRMDSKLAVEQISGNWKIKEPSLRRQVAKVRDLLAGFSSCRFVHIPREENQEADALVNEAIDAAE
jgi:ribonuclease HI